MAQHQGSLGVVHQMHVMHLVSQGLVILSLSLWAPISRSQTPTEAVPASQGIPVPSTNTPPTTPANATQTPASPAPQAFSSYREAVSEVTRLIAGAKVRAYIISDYITDGDVVSSLYLAQYRRIRVQVLLGKTKANQYMSRLGYLKSQNVPVFTRTASFPFRQPTLILADDRLFAASFELNFLLKENNKTKFSIQELSAEERKNFELAFDQSILAGQTLTAAPVPLVGTARGRKALGSTSPRTTRPPVSPAALSTNSAPADSVAAQRPTPPAKHPPANGYVDPEGVYNYTRHKDERPAHLPGKLPKETIEQKKAAGRYAADPGGSGGVAAPTGEAQVEDDQLPKVGGGGETSTSFGDYRAPPNP